jgi:hypothetical protein
MQHGRQCSLHWPGSILCPTFPGQLASTPSASSAAFSGNKVGGPPVISGPNTFPAAAADDDEDDDAPGIPPRPPKPGSSSGCATRGDVIAAGRGGSTTGATVTVLLVTVLPTAAAAAAAVAGLLTGPVVTDEGSGSHSSSCVPAKGLSKSLSVLLLSNSSCPTLITAASATLLTKSPGWACSKKWMTLLLEPPAAMLLLLFGASSIS